MNIEKIKQLKILYIEDEDDLRETTYSSLSTIIPNITLASNGKEGLDKFKNGTFDLIITDLAMPIMTGTEMIKEIRKIDKNIEIFVTTAFSNQNKEVEELQEIGISGYQMKRAVSPPHSIQLIKNYTGFQ